MIGAGWVDGLCSPPLKRLFLTKGCANLALTVGGSQEARFTQRPSILFTSFLKLGHSSPSVCSLGFKPPSEVPFNSIRDGVVQCMRNLCGSAGGGRKTGKTRETALLSCAEERKECELNPNPGLGFSSVVIGVQLLICAYLLTYISHDLLQFCL